MGGANTKENTLTEAEMINSFLPVFYDPLSQLDEETDLKSARSLWKMIADNNAPGYVKMKETPGFDAPNAMHYFYVSFYERLFDVHPSCKPLFKKGIKQQGRHLVTLISMALSQVTDEEKFKRTLEKLARNHMNIGVKAYEYAIVAECHFWTMRLVLGASYDNKAHVIWSKIFSRFLKVMVPIAVRHEIHTAGMHAEREKASRIVVAETHPEKYVETDVNDHESLLILDGKEMEMKYGHDHDAPLTTA